MLQPNFDEGIIDPLGTHINGTGDDVPVLHLMMRFWRSWCSTIKY
jgi:predicted alpha/beta hydrolase